MKHTLYIYIGLLSLAFGLGACSSEEELFPLDESGTNIPSSDVRITFRTNLPTAATTRADGAGMLESEADPTVTTLQMLCFDRYGTYVGRRTATILTSNGTTPDKGTFEGTVPDVTAHIHFIGNLELTFPASSIGKHENVLMHSLETTTFYGSAPKMVYWGYVRKDTPEEMQAWLNPPSNTLSTAWNVVYMIHDRAQVKLATKTEGGSTVVDFDDNTIASIDKWVISNGREHGYVAPFNQSASTATGPFVGYYTETTSGGTTTRAATPVFTECTEGGRYTVTNENKLADATAPLFLYDDINQLGEGATNTVKVILKVTYKTGGTITDANKVRYQVVLLQDKNKQQLHITRNHTYIIHLNRLPWELGYATLPEAVAATSFTNGQMVSVAEAVSDITNGEISMKLNNGKTSVIYQQASDAGRTVLIPFSFAKINGGGAPFTLDDNGDPTTTKVGASNFTLTCDPNTGALSESTADLSIADYDQTTGEGHISMKIGTVSNNLQEAKVTITDKTYGMSRVLNVYTITKFNVTAVTLEKVTGKQRTVSGTNCPTYHLHLELSGNYPDGLYPITVKFATSTLNAFSDTSADQAHGSFGVAVESTADLATSTATNAWNYKASDWGYWYTYEIPARPEGVDDQHPLKLDIYLDDVRGLRQTRASQVGLYLQIDYFGDVKTYTAG